MSGELPEFGLTANRIAADIRERMADIVALVPLITTNEQWQAILAKADPEMRDDVRSLLEPILSFQVPGGLKQEPEEVRRIILGGIATLETIADAAKEDGIVAPPADIGDGSE